MGPDTTGAILARILGPMPSMRRLLPSLVALALLAACARAPQRYEDEAPFLQARQHAYRPASPAGVTSSEERWIVDGRVMDVGVLRPVATAGAPVVVYLPGLGETVRAGEQWRSAWAAAGYAVLSAQPLPEDATAWQSELARDGDFRGLGRKHFAPEPMAERLRTLSAWLAEARRREPGLDWNRLALAGFDLGATTSLAAAGEKPAGLRAVVAISPFVAAAPGESGARWRDLRVPVLSITGPADADPLGLLGPPERRRLPFEQLPAGSAWLLDLQDTPHAALAGSPSYEIARANAERSELARDDMDRQQRQRAPTRRGNDYGDDRFGPGGSSNRARMSPGAGRDAPPLGRLGLQWRVGALADTSTAFLDAMLRDDANARAWLDTQVAARLGEAGRLQRR